MAKRTTMLEWIAEARADIDKVGGLVMLQLVHKVDQKEEEVHSARGLQSGKRSDKDLSELFTNKAETFSQDLIGVQTFGLLAFYGESNQPQARFPFSVVGKLSLDEHGSATEEPTEKGARAQGMRLTEQLAQGYMKGVNQLFQQQTSMIVQLGTYLKEAQEENREALKIVKEVMLEEVKRRSEEKLAFMKYQRDTEERKKWLAMLPAVANQLLGRDIFPRDLEDTALVEGFLDKVGPDELQRLGMVLPAEIMGPLAARGDRYWKEKRATDEEAHRLVEENRDHASPEEALKELSS